MTPAPEGLFNYLNAHSVEAPRDTSASGLIQHIAEIQNRVHMRFTNDREIDYYTAAKRLYKGTLTHFLLECYPPNKLNESHVHYKENHFYEWMRYFFYPQGFVKNFEEAKELLQVAWTEHVRTFENDVPSLYSVEQKRLLYRTLLECKQQFLRYCCDRDALVKAMEMHVSLCFSRVPRDMYDVHEGFDAHERHMMKKRQAPVRWHVSRAGGVHIELVYTRTAEALAQAGIVQLQRVSKQYEPSVKPPKPELDDEDLYHCCFGFEDRVKKTLAVFYEGLKH